MAQGKQAKVLSTAQIRATLQFLQTTRNPYRDTVIFLLSVRAALRAKEISSVTWSMVTDSENNVGNAVALIDAASKGKSGRTIALNKELRSALIELKRHEEAKRAATGFSLDMSSNVIVSERGGRMSPNSIAHWFKRLYANLGFEGCSSHSGRRTAITSWSRSILKPGVGGSLRDVQIMAGHSNLGMTQKYIDQNTDAQKRLVDMV